MIGIRPMTEADLLLGRRLGAQAGWNQTEADWRRFLQLQSAGGFVAELDGRPIGTTMTFLFGPVAWVAMVLVDQTVRGRGIGTALMKHALEFLDERGVASVRLDATPLGQPVYEKLGFVPEFILARYAGALPRLQGHDDGIEPLPPRDLVEVVGLDAEITGAARGELLRCLYAEDPSAFRIARQGERMEGYVTTRPGLHATQIGPCLARGSVGRRLLRDVCRGRGGEQVFLDVPVDHEAAVEVADSLGLNVQRHLLRMGRGKTARERIEDLWASSGPEKG